MDANRVDPRRWLWDWQFLAVITGVILLTFAGIFLVSVFIQSQQPVKYGLDSPRGTIQRYLNLLQAGTTNRAYTMTDIIEYEPTHRMSRAEFYRRFFSWSLIAHHLIFDAIRVRDTSAMVSTDILSYQRGRYGAPLGSSQVTFTLTKVGSRWLITGPSRLPEP